MTSITEIALKYFLNEFISNIKKFNIKIKIINDTNTNVDMMLKSFLILRNVSDSYNYIKTELIKYIHSQNKYICGICGFSYNNPHAYGGHMSKHSKYNMEKANREYYLRPTNNCIVIN